MKQQKMIVWPAGKEFPFAGPMPKVGDIVAGFVVRIVRENAVDLTMPSSPEELEAVEKWEEKRRNR